MNWTTIVIGVLLAALFLFIYRIFKDNFPLIQSVRKKNVSVLKLFAWSILYWSPMLIAIVPGLWANYQLELAVKSSVYEETFITDVDPEEEDFLEDLDHSMTEVFTAYEEELIADIDTLGFSTENAKTDYPPKVGNQIRGTYQAQEAVLLNKPAARFGDFNRWKKRKKVEIFNSISKALTKQSNKQIKSIVNNLAGVVEEELGRQLDSLDVSVDTYSAKAKEIVSAQLKIGRDAAYKTIKNFYLTLKFVKFIFDLLFLIAIIKSFLYVLARVLYSKNSGITFALDFDKIGRKGSIEKKEKNFVIGASSKDTFYVTRKVGMTGAPEKLAIPQFFSCSFSRFFNRAFIMDKIDMEKINEQVQIGKDRQMEFLIYELKNGEVCIFEFRNFVGMTKSVKLKTVFNFQLFSFLFGTIRFSSAKGPGKIIFQSNGDCKVTPQPFTNRANKSFSILAFQKKTRFSVESSLSVADMFFSNYSLKKENAANIIIDSTENDRKRKGVFKFFLRFFIPI